jgi:hypothetical protein
MGVCSSSTKKEIESMGGCSPSRTQNVECGNSCDIVDNMIIKKDSYALGSNEQSVTSNYGKSITDASTFSSVFVKVFDEDGPPIVQKDFSNKNNLYKQEDLLHPTKLRETVTMGSWLRVKYNIPLEEYTHAIRKKSIPELIKKFKVNKCEYNNILQSIINKTYIEI